MGKWPCQTPGTQQSKSYMSLFWWLASCSFGCTRTPWVLTSLNSLPVQISTLFHGSHRDSIWIWRRQLRARERECRKHTRSGKSIFTSGFHFFFFLLSFSFSFFSPSSYFASPSFGMILVQDPEEASIQYKI